MKRKYAVVYERTANNYAAYLPDLPGCISTGKTWEEIKKNIREAIIFHIEDMIACGIPVPHPQMSMDKAMAFHRRLTDAQVGEVLADYDDLVPEEEPITGMIEVEVEPLSDLERLHTPYNLEHHATKFLWSKVDQDALELPNLFVLEDVLSIENQGLVQQIDSSVSHNDKLAIDEVNQIKYAGPNFSYNVTIMSNPSNTEVLPKIDQNASDLRDQKWLSSSRTRQRGTDIYLIKGCA